MHAYIDVHAVSRAGMYYIRACEYRPVSYYFCVSFLLCPTFPQVGLTFLNQSAQHCRLSATRGNTKNGKEWNDLMDHYPELLIDDGPHDRYQIHAFHNGIFHTDDKVTGVINLCRGDLGPALGGHWCFKRGDLTTSPLTDESPQRAEPTNMYTTIWYHSTTALISA